MMEKLHSSLFQTLSTNTEKLDFRFDLLDGLHEMGPVEVS